MFRDVLPGLSLFSRCSLVCRSFCPKLISVAVDGEGAGVSFGSSGSSFTVAHVCFAVDAPVLVLTLHLRVQER
jgi:hypothetical protein